MLSFTVTISISKGIPAQEPILSGRKGEIILKILPGFISGVLHFLLFCFQQIDFNMLLFAAFYSHFPCFKFLSDPAM